MKKLTLKIDALRVERFQVDNAVAQLAAPWRVVRPTRPCPITRECRAG